MPFPVELKYIEELEKNLGLKFPEKYKRKMIQENGGEIQTEDDEWRLYTFLDKSDNKRISRTSNHIGIETINAKEWDNFPSEAIAIGQNDFGDILILLPNENIHNLLDETIYIWNHETGEIIELAENINLI